MSVKTMAKWFHQIGPQQYESLDYPTLRRRWYEGCLRPNDLVWTEGMPCWQPAKSIPNLMPGPYIHQPTRWSHKEQTAVEKHEGALVLSFGLLSCLFFFTCIGIQIFTVLVNGCPAIWKTFSFGINIALVAIILLIPIFSLEAMSMGHADIKKMRVGKMDPSGWGMTYAGYILGVVFSCLYLLAMISVIAAIVILSLSKSVGNVH